VKQFQLLLIVILFLIPAGLFAGPDGVSIDTLSKGKADYYPWITFLSKGPFQLFIEDETSLTKRRAWRVAVLKDEFETGVFIEELRSGKEGCCISISSVRMLDLEQLYNKFGIKGERSDFKFIQWKSVKSFEFSIHKQRFLLTVSVNKQVWVKELQ